MTTYFWEKKESAGSWVPFEGTPTAQNPTEDFGAGTWDVRVTASLGSQSDTKTRTAYVTVEEAPAYVGPLDLVPGALVAFSLRALSSAWRGQNVARLRRGSDNATMDFAADAVTGDFPSAAAIAWRDAVGAADAFVVTRYDQSGNGKDETQAETSLQPLWVPNATNGKAVMDCEATGGLLSTTADINYTDAMTSFVVAKFTATNSSTLFGGGDFGAGAYGFTASNKIGSQAGGGTIGFLGSMIVSDGFNEITVCGTTDDPGATLESWFAAGMTVSDSADGIVNLNGSLQSVTNTRALTITPFAAKYTSGDCAPEIYDGFIGMLGEDIIYGSILTTPNVASIVANQKTYFGV